jgi:hypothetical protein
LPLLLFFFLSFPQGNLLLPLPLLLFFFLSFPHGNLLCERAANSKDLPVDGSMMSRPLEAPSWRPRARSWKLVIPAETPAPSAPPPAHSPPAFPAQFHVPG